MLRKKLAILLIGIALAACSEEPYHAGQVVQAKISRQKGIIIRSYCGSMDWPNCQYEVRFAALTITTNTHLFTDDGPIEIGTSSVVRMHDFELEAAK